MTKAVGILGGTFDPIHFGHLRSALDVNQQLKLDHIRFIPTYQSPTRATPIAQAKHRLAMLKLAVENTPEFVLDTSEIEQAETTYSINTLEKIREMYGVETAIGMIMGMDAYQQFETWYRYQEILQLAHLIILARPEFTLPKIDALENIEKIQVKKDDDLAKFGPNGRIIIMETTQLAISASQIRYMIQAHQSPQFLLPDTVWDYLKQHQLYQDKSNYERN